MNAIVMNGGLVDGGSSGRFLFSSRIPADQRAALEHVLFFNEHQSRVRGALSLMAASMAASIFCAASA